MTLFFRTLQHLHQFSLQLASKMHGLFCHKCTQSDQLVSHGFFYKKCQRSLPLAVGKRVFCSNRYGRKGCGGSFRLYLAHVIPKWRYSTLELQVFLTQLLDGQSIMQAYQVATGTQEPRHAYRWLQRLSRQLFVLNTFLKHRISAEGAVFFSRIRRLQVLLPTIHRLFHQLGAYPCATYQIQTQQPIL